MFFGSIPALVTPFSGKCVDEDSLRKLVDWQVEQGSNALVPCGTTGESPTLSAAEQKRVIELTVEAAAGRVPVIAGCGSNNIAIAIEHLHAAKDAGADAALIVTGYYNKPSQAGLFAAYKALSEASELPIIVYNIPSRAVVEISVDTMAEIAKLPNIAGVKDATGNLGRVTAERLACGRGFIQLSGNDETALAYNATGGVGCISVTANVAPKLCSDFQKATRDGRWDEALELHERLYPLHTALFTDASPGPVKYALSRVRPGFPADVRLPIVEASDSSKRAVDAALEHAGLA
ncbi:MAG TPA: 4-hydroxy-tetrahydrodipicolinate synthase [Sphingomicrobium sp.]|nr:4-hydroxy-tetrahydrodipicolinate synthase [Sphingomicrobium sp.]